MEELFKYYLSEEEKYALIEKLTPELPILRTKAEISQEEIYVKNKIKDWQHPTSRKSASEITCQSLIKIYH